MYRPNRIGPWPLVDLAIASSWPFGANFDVLDAVVADAVRYPQVRTTTIREDFDQVSFVQTGAVSLNFGQRVSFGCVIDGAALNDRSMIYSGAVALGFVQPTNLELELDAWIGRRDGAGVTIGRASAENPVTSYFSLPVDVAKGDGYHRLSWLGSVVSVDHVGDGFGVNPVILGCSIGNHGGSSAPLEGLQVNIALHRYVGDVDTFDPNR